MMKISSETEHQSGQAKNRKEKSADDQERTCSVLKNSACSFIKPRKSNKVVGK